jgi:hypothetical protein
VARVGPARGPPCTLVGFTHPSEVIPGKRAGARRPENPVIRECSISPSHQALPSFSRTSREGGPCIYKLRPQRTRHVRGCLAWTSRRGQKCLDWDPRFRLSPAVPRVPLPLPGFHQVAASSLAHSTPRQYALGSPFRSAGSGQSGVLSTSRAAVQWQPVRRARVFRAFPGALDFLRCQPGLRKPSRTPDDCALFGGCRCHLPAAER